MMSENKFVVLSEDESGDNYIQASMWNARIILRSSYIAEISIASGNDARHYRMKTKVFNVIFSAFCTYFNG